MGKITSEKLSRIHSSSANTVSKGKQRDNSSANAAGGGGPASKNPLFNKSFGQRERAALLLI
jgi:hypothetical protein